MVKHLLRGHAKIHSLTAWASLVGGPDAIVTGTWCYTNPQDFVTSWRTALGNQVKRTQEIEKLNEDVPNFQDIRLKVMKDSSRINC